MFKNLKLEMVSLPSPAINPKVTAPFLSSALPVKPTIKSLPAPLQIEAAPLPAANVSFSAEPNKVDSPSPSCTELKPLTLAVSSPKVALLTDDPLKTNLTELSKLLKFKPESLPMYASARLSASPETAIVLPSPAIAVFEVSLVSLSTIKSSTGAVAVSAEISPAADPPKVVFARPFLIITLPLLSIEILALVISTAIASFDSSKP